MFRLCIWMDVPSHYQSAFFSALISRGDVDLQVRYLRPVSKDRIAQGWNSDHAQETYEQFLDGTQSVEFLLATLPDWGDRIHIISHYMSKNLVQHFCETDVEWCHWSEQPGIQLARMVGFHMNLYRLLAPVMLMLKFREGRQIRKHALLAFSQGYLAEKSFRMMGVPRSMIKSLFYSPPPLPSMEPCRSIKDFSGERKVFLSVGALMPRKGIDVMLKAFAKIKDSNWCLVFCGLDKAAERYADLAKRLGVLNQVLFLGAYPSERIAEVYMASDVFILPSRFDGWGAVLNEAASAGLPLIGADLCGASWHVIEEGNNGYRVKAGSPQALSVAMQSFTGNPQKIENFGWLSKKLYLSEFAPERNAQRLVEALQSKGSKQHA